MVLSRPPPSAMEQMRFLPTFNPPTQPNPPTVQAKAKKIAEDAKKKAEQAKNDAKVHCLLPSFPPTHFSPGNGLSR